jgi:hypothetical protein
MQAIPAATDRGNCHVHVRKTVSAHVQKVLVSVQRRLPGEHGRYGEKLDGFAYGRLVGRSDGEDDGEDDGEGDTGVSDNDCIELLSHEAVTVITWNVAAEHETQIYVVVKAVVV